MARNLIAQTEAHASTSGGESSEAEGSRRDTVQLSPIGLPQHDVLKDEILRKIGRNLLLFQQMEGMLKFLLANGSIDGYGSELEKLREEKGAAINKKTMGQLVGDFVKVHLGAEDSGKEAPGALREVWLSVRFSVDADAAFYEQRKAALADIVADRNELIHHLLPRWDAKSPGSTREVAEYLDRQRERALAEFELLRGMVKSFEEGRIAVAEFMASDEGKNLFELEGFRHSKLVILLGDIAQQIAREDGYVLLNTASELLRLHARDEYAAMSERYGFKSLKALILATKLFDVIEEPTKKGGRRVYYRLKPEWSLEANSR
ncbi:hypothetical protein RA280_43395 [Cupriavidus sp. CV2]|uniref:hypothetical protein n=1 Tax=Cupriavidus ulmosensis TaxID=3065913 RepID=UPI00296AE4C2|nr:hypothetical protein [Cupriavidus sp. CV2]MDW3688456.1 hypothetical protein [Cupriavidus sp. CV2]